MTASELRAWRAYHKWTQQRLANALGISVSRIVDYERGATRGRERPAEIPRYIALAIRALECEEKDKERQP